MKHIILAIILTMPLFAEHILFDFENEADAKQWKQHSNAYHAMDWTDMYATSGKKALRYTAKKFAPGMPEWPAFEVPSPLKDWRPYDRLVLDIANTRLLPPFLAFYVSDAKVPVRQALLHKIQVGATQIKRIVVPLKFPSSVDTSNIHVFHIFTERPTEDFDLVIDRIALLKPGEPVGGPPEAHQQALTRHRLNLVQELIDQINGEIDALNLDAMPKDIAGKLGVGLQQILAQSREKLDNAIAILKNPATPQADLDITIQKIHSIPETFKVPLSIVAFAQSARDAGLDISEFIVGTATSMEKVLPREVPIAIKASKKLQISLARNEKESAQVIVLPVSRDLKGARIVLGELRNANGDLFPAESLQVDTVGYVETKNKPPYAVSHIGWWPDPLLDFCPKVDIKAGDAQAFWIRARTTRQQKPGEFNGKITVEAGNAKPVSLDFSIIVHDFALPSQPPLPTAIAWNHPAFEKTAMVQRGGAENWQKMKFVYADFLADYLFDYGNIYIKTPPDFEVIEYLRSKGKLTAFGLGDATVWQEDKIPQEIERLRPIYEEAKRRNLLKYAYIYAYDECQPDKFPIIEKCAQALKKAFPEVIVMTTSYDHSFGADTIVKSVDAWCPLTPRFDLQKVKAARDAGRFVWWYICCGPHNPFANWFVEYHAIEARLLMGAMTAKYQPDGFLYYSMTIWNDNKPILDGPFTNWNPVSWTTYHGDGATFCFGKDGKPIPTIRIENYRDGLEDYAYHCLLKEAIRRMNAIPQRTAQQNQWLDDAEKAIVVPMELVNNMHSFSRDPKALLAWRDNLARLIVASGFKDMDPWADKDFAVRGWRTKQ